MMKCSIIHYKHGPFLWVLPTVPKEIFNELLKDNCVCCAFEDVEQDNTILGVCRENLVMLIAMKLGT